MTNTRYVAKTVERQLLCESLGHCMNPNCQEDLFATNVFDGEMAHINPHAAGGDTSFENLIILCRRCHRTTDAQRSVDTQRVLAGWKRDRRDELVQRFTAVCSTFGDLATQVRPILRENLAIFQSYGPGHDLADYGRARRLWLQFENRLIANNQKLVHLLRANRDLLHHENRKIVDAFCVHHQEFVLTREDQLDERINLFPAELNSIFGVERVESSLAPFVSPLQNLISRLASQDRYVGLELAPNPTLTYLVGDERVELNLADRPNVQQMYWDWGCYRPRTTGVRLKSLLFVRNWLSRRNCRVRQRSNANLVDVVVSGPLYRTANVFFCENYCVSVQDVFEAPNHDGLIMVNLHGWNDGPFSPEAVQRATEFGIRTMNQDEFFDFVRRGFQ